MKFLLNSNDDWIEQIRRYLYPKLHPILKKFGGFGIGKLREKQYVTTVKISEEELEKELVDIGFERNPIAAYKTRYLDDGKSGGSWRLLPNSDPEGGIEAEKQLHVTLFRSNHPEGKVDIYAHYECNWEKRPRDHLDAVDYDTEWAVDYTQRLINEYSYVDDFDKSE